MQPHCGTDALGICIEHMQATPRSVERLLHDKHEAAAMMGCSWRTIQNLTTKRLLASVRIGRLVRYRRSDIEKALDRLTVKAR
jgi:excisionase family DNA binding protein